ncbi:pseudouridine synthase [Conexibacter sp. DBS9H8]|uniref:pseudouridine synthase n=1 Tax=Conexibacter sp. DBS9H8 TaxID=2937801 RepID=UPI00200E4BAC|nr:pseudouridine synthase [Conexibacter sp. DBS9H8]
MRLQKYLAHAGVASRRRSEEIIAAGRVTVDGTVVTDPARDVGEDAEVTLDGEAVALLGAEDRVLYAVHKPVGVVSTARDTHGRATVVELVPSPLRLYPVGRLDADSSGLILLTNDGPLAHRLTHPSFGVSKTYVVTLTGGPVSEHALRRLRDGVLLEDGPTAPAEVRVLGPGRLEITLREGRKRQVRRMCAAVGHRVRTLQRVGFGPLQLGPLPAGAARRLTPAEVAALLGAGTGARPGAGSSSRARGRSRPG